MRPRTANLLIVLVLLLATASAGMLGSSPSRAERLAELQAATPYATPVSSDLLLYQAVSPAYRSEVIAATSDRLSHYTITATIHAPGAPAAGTPLATPWATPVTSPATTPEISMATPVTRAMATPVVPGATPVASPGPMDEEIAVAPTEELTTITGTLELHFVRQRYRCAAGGALLPALPQPPAVRRGQSRRPRHHGRWCPDRRWIAIALLQPRREPGGHPERRERRSHPAAAAVARALGLR